LNLGGGLLVLLIGALVAYISYKFVARQRFMRQLRIGRITVEELKTNSTLEKNWSSWICATLWILRPTPKPFPALFAWMPRNWRKGQPVAPRPRSHPLLHLTKRSYECPCGAHPANHGIRRIRPLQGGLEAWRQRGYPVHNATLTQITGVVPAATS